MSRVIFIDIFTVGLDEIPFRLRRDYATVLRVLNAHKRFSVFEATANLGIANTMTELVQEGYIETDNSCGFPWTNCELTKKGRELIMQKKIFRTHSEFIGFVLALQRQQCWYKWRKLASGYSVRWC